MMNLKRWVALLCCWVLLCPLALAEGNLIKNGGFDAGKGAHPDSWRPDMWDTAQGISVLEWVPDGGEDGSPCIMVSNMHPNDARYIQTIDVEPNSCYKITGRVKAEGIGQVEGGLAASANLSIKDTFTSTRGIFDTAGEWVTLELVGITGEDQQAMTVMCRVGGYSALTSGTAWFDDIVVEKLENAVLDLDMPKLYSNAPTEEDDFFAAPDAQGGMTAGEVQMVLLFGVVLLFIAVAAVVWVFAERGRITLARSVKPERYAVGILLIALFLRCVIAVLVRGYEVDINCFSGWAASMAELGPARFYSGGFFCDYPPGYLYVLWFVGGLHKLLGLDYGTRLSWLVIKLVPIVLDCALAWMIYLAARKRTGVLIALLIMALAALSPATILNSAAWGQIDVVLALLMVLVALLIIDDKWEWALAAYALAVLAKPQALMFGPLGLVALVMRVVWVERTARAAAFKRMLRAVLMAVAGFLLMSLPFILALDPKVIAEAKLDHLPAFIQPVAWLIRLYGNTMGSYRHITVNACNLYTLMAMNWKPIAEVPGAANFATAMTVIGCLMSMVLYIRAKDPGKLSLIGALLLLWLFCFGPMMHERYLFPALALLLLAYAIERDVRLMCVFFVLTLTQFMNAALVLRSEHLLDAEQVVNAGLSLMNMLAALTLLWTAVDLCFFGRTMAITKVYQMDTRAEALRDSKWNRFADSTFNKREYKLSMVWRDWALMLGLTLVYAAVAFVNLGTTQAPQTTWTSTAQDEQITVDLGQVREFHLAYYGSSFNDVNFLVELSDDGETWSEPYYAAFDRGLIFRWLWYEPMVELENGGYARLDPNGTHPLHTGRYARLTMAGSGLILNEVAFVSALGEVFLVTEFQVSGGDLSPTNLFDEASTVPAYPSYFNGTYFDEIYHARTGYENLHGLRTYETTHPPLGKVLIMLGIKLFGMTPFGWRFMGALFGVLMVPLMYLMAKQLIRRTSLAFLAAALMATDLMHFTQTRIATIDSFAVFFIMLMYLFMFRYYQMSFYHQPLWRTLIPLALSGIAMGLGIASKWIGIYAAAGLAVLFFTAAGMRLREYLYVRREMDQIDTGRREQAQQILKTHWRNQIITLLWCVVFFVAVPLMIYYFSFYWQMAPEGGLSIEGVWGWQEYMWGYHSTLKDPHGFQSPWYQWPVIGWPMWFYTGNEYMRPGMISSISCMGNPAVFWVGLVAILYVLGRVVLRRPATWLSEYGLEPRLRHLHREPGRLYWINWRSDYRYLLIGVGFLSQYLPWVLVPRSTFIYHYFASIPFIILATALGMDGIRRHHYRLYRKMLVALLVIAAVLFIFFYPIASGTPIPRWYAQWMRWFNWVNF